MKKKYVKSLSICLCALVIGGTLGNGFARVRAEETQTRENETVTEEAVKKSVGEVTKDETVYVFTKADGSVENMIVSDWLKNQAGEDVYRQEQMEKELPVDLKISYKLDGKEIDPEELAGKSGKVTIRFDYTNKQYKMVEIKGKQEKIYVPFAVLTGVLLDNEVFRNVEVSNGKCVNDGNRTVVTGVAFPGLQGSLNIDKEKLEFPEAVEIQADVTGFELMNTISIATNTVFNELDTAKLDDADELSRSLGEMSDAMGQLMDGSSQLYDGLSTLLQKSKDLVGGINQLADGSKKLKDGTSSLKSGAGDLEAGAKQLADGLEKLDKNSATLNAGAKQVFQSMLAMADGQLAAAGVPVPKLTIENYGTVLGQVIGTLQQSGAPEQAIGTLRALKGQLDSYHQFYAGLSQYTAGVSSAKTGAAKVSAGASQLKGGSTQLDGGMDELNKGIATMKTQAPALIDGVTQLKDGSQRLSDGLKEFDEKAVQKLIDAVDGDLGSLVDRIKATVNVSKEYSNFSGLSDGADGEVKFLYRTNQIEAKNSDADGQNE